MPQNNIETDGNAPALTQVPVLGQGGRVEGRRLWTALADGASQTGANRQRFASPARRRDRKQAPCSEAPYSPRRIAGKTTLFREHEAATPAEFTTSSVSNVSEKVNPVCLSLN
jgi:hypothetical protein